MIYSRPETPFDAWLTDAPTGLAGTLTVCIEEADTGTVVVAETTSGITEPRTNFYKVTLTAPDGADITVGDEPDYFVVWKNGSVEIREGLKLTSVSPVVGVFATVGDVEDRLGRDLTEAQQTQAETTIATVTGLILDEVDRDADWAEALDPVSPALKALCVEKAIQTISRPEPAVAAESLGAHSVTYARETAGSIFLTDVEGRLVRMAVYGTLSGSSTPRSAQDRLIDLSEARDVDEEAA